MENKITVSGLAAMVALATGQPGKLCEDFLRELFKMVGDELEKGENVRIKGLGTFKIVDVEPRKSVDVTTGAQNEIPAHRKVIFVATKELASLVNGPFEAFDAVEVSDALPTDALLELIDAEGEEAAESLENTDVYVAASSEGVDDKITETDNERITEAKEYSLTEEEYSLTESEANGPVFIRKDEPESGADEDEANAADSDGVPSFVKNNDSSVITFSTPLPPKAPRKDIVDVDDEKHTPQHSGDIPATISFASDDEDRAENEDMEVETERRGKRFGMGFLAGFLSAILLAIVVLFISVKVGLIQRDHASHDSPTAEVKQTEVIPEADGEERLTDSVPVPADAGEAAADSAVTATQPAAAAEEVPTRPSDEPVYDTVSTTRYLTTMAQEHYGNFNLWPVIYEENQSKLGHPDRIRPGTKVVIPPLSKYNVDPSNPEDVAKVKRKGVAIYARFKRK